MDVNRKPPRGSHRKVEGKLKARVFFLTLRLLPLCDPWFVIQLRELSSSFLFSRPVALLGVFRSKDKNRDIRFLVRYLNNQEQCCCSWLYFTAGLRSQYFLPDDLVCHLVEHPESRLCCFCVLFLFRRKKEIKGKL
ncbi:hypothetical protein OPV22_010141 [Ensete ventricosum]|uniref:Uncharacterized protein n=1 Tax=Ensete ventricosum TaxID=4639 RepID=A0AAV8RIJ0_ENSVE|nr:hypothetical protein OPV22_010141 [Ensete ventricosum]